MMKLNKEEKMVMEWYIFVKKTKKEITELIGRFKLRRMYHAL